MIFLDSNVLIDVFGQPSEAAAWARAVYAKASASERMVCNLIVVAEVAVGFEHTETILDDLNNLAVVVLDLDAAVALRSAHAFRLYRQRGGTRTRTLPDFLIAAHAELFGASLATRDRRIASYFPDLTLITPETHPYG